MRPSCNAAFWLCNAAFWCIAAAGCGTLSSGEDSPGGQAISSGAGPYTRLPGDQEKILTEFGVDLFDAQVLPGTGRGASDGFTVYFSRHDGFGTTIRRARFASLGATPVIDPVLAADQPWEAGDVYRPAVVAPARAGEKWLLCYATATDAIGCADSDDGNQFAKNPLRLATPPDQARHFTSPALVRLDPGPLPGAHDRVRLFFVEHPTLFATDIARDDTGWHFVTLDAATGFPAVHRILGPGDGPWLVDGIGRTTARTLTTPAGRTRYDLFYSGSTGGSTAVAVVGLAASWDGLEFIVAAAPFLGVKPPGATSPTVATLADGSHLLLINEFSGAHLAIGAATAP